MSTAQIDILVQVRDQLDGLRRTREGFEDVNRASQGWLDSFRNGAAFAVATAAIDRVGGALKSVATVGIQFNSALEQARLGIAAVQKQANPVAFAKFDDALAASAAAVDLLQEKARMSPASFQQLVEGFQAITGAATGAGIPLRQQVDLVVLLSQAVAGLGLRADQFVQESRALLTGNITEDASLARMLGITKADIDRARQAGTLFDFISGKLAAFKEAGERGAGTFATLWSNLKDALEQASATATLPAFEAIKKGLADVSEFDWQGAGQRAAQFTELVIAAWQKGRLTEVISLTIAAGFEIGWAKTKDWLFSDSAADLLGDFTRLLLRLTVALTTKITEIVVDIATGIGLPFVAAFGFIAESITALLWNGFIKLRQEAARLFNWAAEKVGSSSRMDEAAGDGNKMRMPTFGSYFDAAQQSRAEFQATTKQFFKGANDAAADLWSGGAVQGDSAQAQLKKVYGELGLVGKEAKAAAVEVKTVITAVPVLLDWKKAERDAEEAIRKIQEERSRIEADFTRTAAEKWHERSRLLAEEKKAIEELIAALDVRAGQETNPQVAEQIRSRADTARNKLVGVNGQIAGQGANPDDVFQQVYTKWTALKDRMGTDAQTLATVITAPFEGLFTGLSSSIEGLINMTMTWGEALLNIGRSVVSSLVKAFSDMVAQWIMSHIIMKGVSLAWAAFSTALGWQKVGESNAQEAAKTPALAANATLASVSSWGVAVLVGVAAIAAILASVGAFADGGLISGPGGPREDRVLARVSPGEYIVPADAVQAIGLDNMKMIRDGQLPMMAPASAANVNVSSGATHVAILNNEQQVRRFMESEAGRKLIVDAATGRRMDLGLSA
jgi:hypothetical protein